MTVPASPPATRHRLPSWVDLRLVLGVLLVLISVLVGARVVALADRTVRVWAAGADLAAGTVLARGDLRSVRVRLVDNPTRYIRTDRSPVGRTLSRDVGEGELLPVDATAGKPCGSEVSIPVGVQHVPGSIRRGLRVDVFATGKGNQAAKTELVLGAATVQAVLKPQSGFLSANAEWAVIVRVPDEQVGTVVSAVRTADIDMALVRTQPPAGAGGCGTVPGTGAPGTASPSPSGRAPGESNEPAPSPSSSTR